MDAQHGELRAQAARATGTAFGLLTQGGFVLTVWRLFWFLYHGTSVSGTLSPSWIWVDALLALQFAVAHSALLLPSSRSRLSAWLPSSLFGTLFCAVTCAGLWLVFSLWQTCPKTLWNLEGAPAMSMRVAFFASWGALIYSLWLVGIGYQTGWTQWRHWLKREPLPPRPFLQRGAFRWLRHPVYFSFLGLIWFTPRMTLDHALLTAIWTGYVFVGSVLKDRRLLYYLGDPYREYAARVPGYPGMFFGPLARWPQPATTPAKSRAASISRAA